MAETIDPACGDKVPHRRQSQFAHGRLGEIQRVAAAGIVDEAAIGGMGIGGIIQPAQA